MTIIEKSLGAIVRETRMVEVSKDYEMDILLRIGYYIPLKKIECTYSAKGVCNDMFYVRLKHNEWTKLAKDLADDGYRMIVKNSNLYKIECVEEEEES